MVYNLLGPDSSMYRHVARDCCTDCAEFYYGQDVLCPVSRHRFVLYRAEGEKYGFQKCKARGSMKFESIGKGQRICNALMHYAKPKMCALLAWQSNHWNFHSSHSSHCTLNLPRIPNSVARHFEKVLARPLSFGFAAPLRYARASFSRPSPCSSAW